MQAWSKKWLVIFLANSNWTRSDGLSYSSRTLSRKEIQYFATALEKYLCSLWVPFEEIKNCLLTPKQSFNTLPALSHLILVYRGRSLNSALSSPKKAFGVFEIYFQLLWDWLTSQHFELHSSFSVLFHKVLPNKLRNLKQCSQFYMYLTI